MNIRGKLYKFYGNISYLLKLEYLGARILPQVNWQIKTKNKWVYLTFDDGPHPTRTLKILDILDTYGIKATFFCIGKNILQYPEIIKQISLRGHDLANHTMHHNKLIFNSNAELTDEITAVENLYKNLGINYRKLLRPPFGLITKGQQEFIKKLGYEIIIGDIYPRDSNNASTQQIIQRVSNNIHNGAILILHDGVDEGKSTIYRRSTLFALDDVIDNAKRNGFTFRKFPKTIT